MSFQNRIHNVKYSFIFPSLILMGYIFIPSPAIATPAATLASENDKAKLYTYETECTVSEIPAGTAQDSYSQPFSTIRKPRSIIIPKGVTSVDKIYLHFHGKDFTKSRSSCNCIEEKVTNQTTDQLKELFEEKYKLSEYAQTIKTKYPNVAIFFPRLYQSGNTGQNLSRDELDCFLNEAKEVLNNIDGISYTPSSGTGQVVAVSGHSAGGNTIRSFLELGYSTQTSLLFDACYDDWCRNAANTEKGGEMHIYYTTVNDPGTIPDSEGAKTQHSNKIRLVKTRLSHGDVLNYCSADHINQSLCEKDGRKGIVIGEEGPTPDTPTGAIVTDSGSMTTDATSPNPDPYQEGSLSGDVLRAAWEGRNMTVNELEAFLQKPQTKIKIPGVNFSEVSRITEEEDGISKHYIIIPFLGEYIAAIYKYVILVITVLAVVGLIDGGVTYVLRGSNEEGRKVALDRVKGAILGILIATMSYTLLYSINPDLVKFKNLKALITEPINFDDTAFDKTPYNSAVGSFDFTGSGPGDSVDVSPSDLDSIFKAYAACYGMDWRILKGIARKESGLNVNAGAGKKYQGLFQMDTTYCNQGIKPFKHFLSCDNRLDPNVNTAAASNIINRNIKKILSKCPNNPLDDTLLLLYVGHNNGPAVMKYAIENGGCKGDDTRLKVREWYNKKPGGNHRGVDANWGERKYNYGKKVVEAVRGYGATEIHPAGAQNNKICPINTGKKVAVTPTDGSTPTEGSATGGNAAPPNVTPGEQFMFVALSDTNGSYGSINQPSPVKKAVSALQGMSPKPSFIMHVGDMIAGGKNSHTKTKIQEMWAGFTRDFLQPITQSGLTVFPVAGNHDASMAPQPTLLEEYVSFWNANKPNQTMSGSYPKNYSFDYGGWHFVVLWAPSRNNAQSSEHLSWLKTDLNQNSSKNTLVFGHVHLAQICEEADDAANYCEGGMPEILSVLKQNPQVRAYFHGHQHVYYKGVKNGVNVISTGHLGSGNFKLGTQTQSAKIIVVVEVSGNDFAVRGLTGSNFSQQFNESGFASVSTPGGFSKSHIPTSL